MSASGGRLKPGQVFTGHTGDLEFLGRWGAGKECFFWCLRDRWEQGVEWEGDEQMWKGRTGCPAVALAWWTFTLLRLCTCR